MAVTAERVAVGDTATPLNAPSTSGLRLLLVAETAGINVGPSTVAAGDGLELPDGVPVTVELDAGDVLHAVHATSGTVQVLRT